ncbi:MAG: MIP/aquaporin family protein [Acidobacteriota bacterium]
MPGDHGAPGDETEAGRALRGFDARRLISLEPPFGRRLDDPVVELRRLFAELLGTAMLVLVAAGAPVVDTVVSGSVSASAQVVAPGMVVMAIVYGIGAVGGAHLNPAVTLSFAVRGNFPWVRVPGYVAMQLLGAVIAVVILRWLFGDVGGLGATVPADVVTDGRAVAVEALLTLGLVTVILGTATGAKNVGANAAIAIGGYVALAGLWAAPITGASMNPARSFGPMLVSGDWDHGWVYVVGPVLGGLVAVGCAWLLRGPPSPAADVAAQGLLEPPMRG